MVLIKTGLVFGQINEVVNIDSLMCGFKSLWMSGELREGWLTVRQRELARVRCI